MSSPTTLTSLSLSLIEETYGQAMQTPIERAIGVRLALAWLVHVGIAKDWQAKEFWRELGRHDPEAANGCIGYTRQLTLTTMVHAWLVAAGFSHQDASMRLDRAKEAGHLVDLHALEDQIWRMCNRYQPGETESIRRFFNAKKLAAFNDGPSIVHPGQLGLIIRSAHGEYVLEQATWGFPVVLHGKNGKPLKPKPVNNARFDKLGSYWRRWAEHPYNRCLIPLTRFAEAEGDYGSMTTTWISQKVNPIFAWAGLWAEKTEWGPSYTGVMTDAAPDMMAIHDRCPVIIHQTEWEAWLTAPLKNLGRFDYPLNDDAVKINRTSVPWSKGGDPTQFG